MPNMGLQSSVFSVIFDFALVWHFFDIARSLPFEMKIFNVCHCMLEVCNLIYDIIQFLVKGFS